MFGFNYIKFDTMDHAIHYQNGKVKREGRGLSFFYFTPNSSIIRVPVSSSDLRFIFTQVTGDFQEVTVQGQLTYRIAEPRKVAEILDLTINGSMVYLTDDYEKLEQRIINEAQATTSSYVLSLSLKEALSSVAEVEKEIVNGLSNSNMVNMLGLEIMGVNVFDVRATPEMAKALEAQTRESLQQEADQAIYERRNFAVEQERKIKESELNTEIAVEEKQKQIVEKQMETDVVREQNDRKILEMKMDKEISVENQKKGLIEMKVENDMKAADIQEYVLNATLKPYKDLNWKTLMAINGSNQDPKMNIALAFREFAENADKIGTLNISPDLLDSLLQTQTKARTGNKKR